MLLTISRSGYDMSELLYLFGEMDHRVRPLVYVVRSWAKRNGLIENIRPTFLFTNFIITLMVVFFLQYKYAMLPSFATLQKLAGGN